MRSISGRGVVTQPGICIQSKNKSHSIISVLSLLGIKLIALKIIACISHIAHIFSILSCFPYWINIECILLRIPLNFMFLFQQHKRRLYTWTLPDGQHWNQIDYILCHQRWRSSIQSAKTRPGADCGSDHELLIAKFRLKLKKVWKPLDHSGMT